MASSVQWRKIYDGLFRLYGECKCPLEHESPFQLLVAVMLSAQCRDDRVNIVTRSLFSEAPDPASMASLPVERIAEIIRPCGLYRNKSENLSASAQKLVEKFNGEVPRTMEELLLLPGIGRKSANVILGNAFGIPGFPVDTHVNRLLNRIGLVNNTDPVKIEQEQNAKIPPERWSNFSHLLIQHGRHICKARNPDCDQCAIRSHCKQFKVKVR